mgnify:CR=1 FL=1
MQNALSGHPSMSLNATLPEQTPNSGRSVLLVLGLLASAASAMDEKPLSTYSREVWTTRDGLPHNLVNGIAQTPDGYLWFATWEGVVRYNGQEFRVFGRQNVPELEDNGIRSVMTNCPSGTLKDLT